MAKRNYLVEGLSGAGKSSVYEELIRRGYKAISTDRAWAFHGDRDTGLAGGPIRHDTHMWHRERAVSELESATPEVLFVCGSSRNRDHFLPHFTKVFNLSIDDETMRRRLEVRTEDDWPLGQDGVELMLALNRNGEKPAGAIDVDATEPLPQVVDELLRLADCRPESDSWPTPWSKRGSATAESFVIAESALQTVRVPAGLDRQTIARIEYGWSGDVVTTLLSYLDEQGIDLRHLQIQEGSVFVLTSDHRERYLALLDPSAFDGAVLRRYYEERNELTADGVDYAMLDGIAFLRDTLARLQPAIVAVLVVG